MKSFIHAFSVFAMVSTASFADAGIQSGRPVLDPSLLQGGGLRCLVRYHGLTSLKKHYPNATDGNEKRFFAQYLETGAAGQHGVSLPLFILPDAPFSGYLRLIPFEFVEADFGLKFSVNDQSGNAYIKKDARDAVGDLSLSITDLVTGKLISTSDFPIEMFFSGGYSIPQITIGLPARILEQQKQNLTWDKDLLTQVRFQCN